MNNWIFYNSEEKASPLSVEVLAEDQYDAWDHFVATTPGGTVFQSAWWHKAWQGEFAILALRGHDGDIVAGLPLNFGEVLGVRAITAPPLSPISGPVWRVPNHPSRALRRKIVAMRIGSLLMACPRVVWSQFVMLTDHIDLSPFMWNGYEAQASQNIVILREESDVWQSNISRGHLKKLRKALHEWEYHGCTLEVHQSFEEVLPLFKETASSKGFNLAHSSRLLNWWRAVRAKGSGRVYLIRDREGSPLCSAVLVLDSTSAYYLLGGMSEKIRRNTNLGMLLFKPMIEDSHRMGLNYDLEAITPSRLVDLKSGLEQFFLGWGGSIQPVCRLVRDLSNPLNRLWNEKHYRHLLGNLI